jgi:hypothetical protein
LICRSIERHPKLQRLCLVGTGPTGEGTVLSAKSNGLRTSAIVQMIQVNGVLEEVNVTPAECDEQILSDVIDSSLFGLRKNIREVNENRCNPSREQLLGRALHRVNGDPTLLWMMLSNDLDIEWAGL